jgi:hypothetical protein
LKEKLKDESFRRQCLLRDHQVETVQLKRNVCLELVAKKLNLDDCPTSQLAGLEARVRLIALHLFAEEI